MNTSEVLVNPYYKPEVRLGQTTIIDDLKAEHPDLSIEEAAGVELTSADAATRGAFMLQLADLKLDLPAFTEKLTDQGIQVTVEWPNKEVAAFIARRSMLVEAIRSGSSQDFTVWRETVEADTGARRPVSAVKKLAIDNPKYLIGKKLYEKDKQSSGPGYADSLRQRAGSRPDSSVIWGAEGSRYGAFENVTRHNMLASVAQSLRPDIWLPPFVGARSRTRDNAVLTGYYGKDFCDFVNDTLPMGYRLGQPVVEK